LIWVAHNAAGSGQTAKELLEDFELAYRNIKLAEERLYGVTDRHKATAETAGLQQELDQAIEAFQNRMPKVFDPFAGGGAIPLEAARLGCKTYGNDLNPVAHIIQKGSLEFPQKYGKPIRMSKSAFIEQYGEKAFQEWDENHFIIENGDRVGAHIDNRLAQDVVHYAKVLLEKVKAEVGHYYPEGPDGKTPIAYYWARVGKCANPACGAEVPLLRSFSLVNKKDKKIYLVPSFSKASVLFKLSNQDSEIKPFVIKKNLVCPFCSSVTNKEELKKQSINGLEESLITVIEEGTNGKEYRLPEVSDVPYDVKINSEDIPHEKITPGDSRNLWLTFWGITQWSQMFTPRQLLTLQTFVDQLQELRSELTWMEEGYRKAVITYLGIWVDRIAIVNTSFGVWHTSGEKLERPMGRHSIPMVFDFPESNPFCESTGSALNQLNWIERYIESESSSPFSTVCNNASSGDKSQFEEKYLDAVVTDPPYYDAIAYADLSDFFYVWLKRTIAEEYPLAFAFPQTPKGEECTALKHHHNGKAEKAKIHFEGKLQSIFSAIEQQTKGVVSIMFAHQSTEAWSTLINSVLGANMNITSSWANDTEMMGALKKDKAFLASSVTVACKPVQKKGYGDYKEIRGRIMDRIKSQVEFLYHNGFRGADLLTACFGQAVSEFGQYRAVEKSSGEIVSVPELLDITREAAFNAIVSDLATDSPTRFYIGWLNLFGFTKAEHDNVRQITQIGLDVDVGELQKQVILITDGNKQTLAELTTRMKKQPRLGLYKKSSMIDKVHRAMYLFGKSNRQELLEYLKEVAPKEEGDFWRVLNALVELVPSKTQDYSLAAQLLVNKENLLKEAQQLPMQTNLFDQ
ncbi:DUF1156 domain-containing protein, partial [Phaeodactylibacter xiamenensis]|uniref:DUF1156 domain-containing protein n=1 Tax=Phaeodactylibacter xiamenensis TaxID=1524460 RepID=UPI0024A9B774